MNRLFYWIKNTLESALSLIFPISKVESKLKSIKAEELKSRFPNEWLSSDKKTIAIFPYKNPFIRQSVWLLKYRKNEDALNIFAQILGESIIATCEEILPFCSHPRIILIPIPTTKKRSLERGHNHTLILAYKTVEIYGRDFFEIAPDVLIFAKETKRQTSCKNKKEREENMKNAFAISKNKPNPNFSGRMVVLIDDVTTTGATFRDARRAINSLGAIKPKQIYFFALAH
ncbi:MAG: hypothetical protein AAB513_02220 [Patescibacteria group bacterium]